MDINFVWQPTILMICECFSPPDVKSLMQTAAQKEDDRETKLLQKAALYDRLHSGEACSEAPDFLVDFERLVQEQEPSAAPHEALPRKPPEFQPIEFRQRGFIQVILVKA